MRDSFEKQIPHIHFKDVSFAYPEKKENLIFKCNFSIHKPGFWMIVGKNGSGKSTLPESSILLWDDHTKHSRGLDVVPHLGRQVAIASDLVVIEHLTQLLYFIVHETLLVGS